MRPPIASAFLLALLLSLAGLAAAAKPANPAANLKLAQAERIATDLKQGMSAEDVRQMLGKPRRTALKASSSATAAPWEGSLQWTYIWNDATGGDGVLNIQFASKTQEDWYVHSWEWTGY